MRSLTQFAARPLRVKQKNKSKQVGVILIDFHRALTFAPLLCSICLLKDLAFRQEATDEKNHVTWNAERRCFLSVGAAERYLK